MVTSAHLQQACELLWAERAELLAELAALDRQAEVCSTRISAIDTSLSALAAIDIAPVVDLEPPASAAPAEIGPADPELDRLLDEEMRIATRLDIERKAPAEPTPAAPVPTAAPAPAGDPTSEPGPPARHELNTVPDYVEVARVVNRARREGEVTKRAVCVHFSVKATTAANWLTKCRNLGLLVEPTAPTEPTAPVDQGPVEVDDTPWTAEPISRGSFDADAAREAAAVSMTGTGGPIPDAALVPSRPTPAPPAERPINPTRVWTVDDATALIEGTAAR